MNISDIGVVISKKHFQENSYIISIFTENHGLYSGIIKKVEKKHFATYMIGNLINFTWHARLHSHIGIIRGELIKSYTIHVFNNKIKLYALNSILSLIKLTFHEREPHNNFFPLLINYLNKMENAFNLYDYIQLELGILLETGYELSLNECAVTGSSDDLFFVSPKTGKAVSFAAGKEYADKLLKFPTILRAPQTALNINDTRESFVLTSYFFNRYFNFNKKSGVHARETFINLMCNLDGVN